VYFAAESASESSDESSFSAVHEIITSEHKTKRFNSIDKVAKRRHISMGAD